MNTLTNLNTFPLGNSLDGINIITEEIESTALLVDGTNYMLADLNMDNHTIKNLDAGVDGLDAVNKNQLDTKAETTYVNTQLALKVNKAGDTMTGSLNMSSNKIINVANGTSNLDAVNRSQLNAKADTSYVNTEDNLRLKRDGTDVMTGSLNMNSNKIINVANGTSSNDAVNKSQLDVKADITYVNTQSVNSNYVLRNGSLAMTGILDMNLNRIRNVADPLLIQDAVTKTYSDTQNNNLKTYTDSSLNTLRGYVDTRETIIRADVNTGLNLKVNKAGDTMTGPLIITETTGTSANTGGTLTLRHNDVGGKSSIVFPSNINYGSDYAYIEYRDNYNTPYNENSALIIGIENDATGTTIEDKIYFKLNGADRIAISGDGKLGINKVSPTEMLDVNGNGIFNTPSSTANINKQLALRVNNEEHNGLFFHNNLTGGSFNSLVDTNDKAIIFSDGTAGTGKLVIGNWGSSGMKLDCENGQMTLNSNQTINKNGAIINYFTYVPNLSNTIYLTSGNTIYDGYTLNNNDVLIYLPYENGSDSSLVNKNVYFNTTYTTRVWGGGAGQIYVNGVGNAVSYIYYITGPFRIYGQSTIGYYTLEVLSEPLSSTDQLILKSNYGDKTDTEFTGISFNNNNTDVGLIRVESNRLNNNNSVMRFYNRSSNVLTLPLEINNNINAYIPIIRNAWSSGEVIQTKIYNQNNSGSGNATINPNVSLNWKSVTFETKNPSPTTSNIIIKVDCPYYYTGSNNDYIVVAVYDTTGGVATEIYQKVQYYEGAGGGGTRSGPIFPLVCSHTPSQSPSTQTRTYAVQIANGSNFGGDILYICYGWKTSLISFNYYTIEVTEIRL